MDQGQDQSQDLECRVQDQGQDHGIERIFSARIRIRSSYRIRDRIKDMGRITRIRDQVNERQDRIRD